MSIDHEGVSQSGRWPTAQYNTVPVTARQPAIKSPFRRPSTRLNYIGILISWFVPCLVFTVLYALESGQTNYNSHSTVSTCFVVSFLAALVFLFLAFDSWQRVKKQAEDGDDHLGAEPMWYLFLAVTILIATVSAYIVGLLNYNNNMRIYEEYANFNTYQSVNVANTSGFQMMDGGIVTFSDASIDFTLQMAFKDSTTYCVAPIVNSETSLSYYDFWIVGKDCCENSQFTCGDVFVKGTNSGLRLLDDSARAFYRLAVQQAEGTHDIKAPHPIFYTWQHDAVSYVDNLRLSALSYWVEGVCIFIAFQTFIVISTTLFFAKMRFQ
jgi:uncharacterized membrane protein YidH (DUF202 family)